MFKKIEEGDGSNPDVFIYKKFGDELKWFILNKIISNEDDNVNENSEKN